MNPNPWEREHTPRWRQGFTPWVVGNDVRPAKKEERIKLRKAGCLVRVKVVRDGYGLFWRDGTLLATVWDRPALVTFLNGWYFSRQRLGLKTAKEMKKEEKTKTSKKPTAAKKTQKSKAKK